MSSEFGAIDPYDAPDRCEYCYSVMSHGVCSNCDYEDYNDLDRDD